MSKASPRGTQGRTAPQTGEDVFATALFDGKTIFFPALEITDLGEIVQAELGARLLKNHSQDSSSDGNVS